MIVTAMSIVVFQLEHASIKLCLITLESGYLAHLLNGSTTAACMLDHWTCGLAVSILPTLLLIVISLN